MESTRSAHRRTRYEVFEQLRARIISMELLPGTPISENDLSARLGVSRTPIREALLLLMEEGLIEVVPKVGTFVALLDMHQVSEAQFLREAVEIASLRSLDLPLRGELVAALEDNLRQQVVAADEELSSFLTLDEAFHRGLMALAGHESSWSSVAAAKGHLDRARVVGIQHVPNLSRFVEQHTAVFEALKANDIDLAEARLREHLRVIFTDIQHAQADNPELFGPTTSAPERRPSYRWSDWARYTSHRRMMPER